MDSANEQSSAMLDADFNRKNREAHDGLLIERLIDIVTSRDNLARSYELLDKLTMRRRVRLYLWSKLLEAQTPDARSWYFNGYHTTYMAQNPEREMFR